MHFEKRSCYVLVSPWFRGKVKIGESPISLRFLALASKCRLGLKLYRVLLTRCRSWAMLGPSWAHLRPPKNLLGTVLRHIGVFLATFRSY